MKQTKFSLISYLKSAGDIQAILDKKAEQILSYAYILHDKDTFEKDVFDKDSGELLHQKGALKEPHYHIVLFLVSSRETKQIANWFTKKNADGTTTHCLSQIVKFPNGIIKYLTHSTTGSEKKYQYSADNVVSYNIDGILQENDAIDECYEILTKMRGGESLMELVRQYGRDFLYHYSSYRQISQDISDCVDHRTFAEKADAEKATCLPKPTLPWNCYEQLGLLEKKDNGVKYE